MTDTPSETGRERNARDKSSSQARALRMYLVIEAGGVIGAVVLALSLMLPPKVWGQLPLPASDEFIRSGAMLTGVYLMGLGLSAVALIFLRTGLISPRGISRHVRRLE